SVFGTTPILRRFAVSSMSVRKTPRMPNRLPMRACQVASCANPYVAGRIWTPPAGMRPAPKTAWIAWTAAIRSDGLVRYTIKVFPWRYMPPNAGTRAATWPKRSSNVLAGTPIATPSDVDWPVGITLTTNRAITATARDTLENRFHESISDPRARSKASTKCLLRLAPRAPWTPGSADAARSTLRSETPGPRVSAILATQGPVDLTDSGNSRGLLVDA